MLTRADVWGEDPLYWAMLAVFSLMAAAFGLAASRFSREDG